ncbi:MAG: hypothetical protein H6705_02585 [Myxococcales bacterium]|nr:hypothetical protein [Myxococcales bacterium]
MDEAALAQSAPPATHRSARAWSSRTPASASASPSPPAERLIANDDGSSERAELLAPEGDALLRSRRVGSTDVGVTAAEIDDFEARRRIEPQRTFDPAPDMLSRRRRALEAHHRVTAAPPARPAARARSPAPSSLRRRPRPRRRHPDAAGRLRRPRRRRLVSTFAAPGRAVASVFGVDVGHRTWRDDELLTAFLTPPAASPSAPTPPSSSRRCIAGYIAAEESSHGTYIGYRATSASTSTAGRSWARMAGERARCRQHPARRAAHRLVEF